MLKELGWGMFLIIVAGFCVLIGMDQTARYKAELQLTEQSGVDFKLKIEALENVVIANQGNHVYKVTCPSARCDLSRLNDLFMSLYAGKIDFGVIETGHTGPGWTITVSPAPSRN